MKVQLGMSKRLILPHSSTASFQSVCDQLSIIVPCDDPSIDVVPATNRTAHSFESEENRCGD